MADLIVSTPYSSHRRAPADAHQGARPGCADRLDDLCDAAVGLDDLQHLLDHAVLGPEAHAGQQQPFVEDLARSRAEEPGTSRPTSGLCA